MEIPATLPQRCPESDEGPILTPVRLFDLGQAQDRVNEMKDSGRTGNDGQRRAQGERECETLFDCVGCQGVRTTLRQSSSFFSKILYAVAASASGIR
jgi:hypothetical protein